jgi:hypothetical protein
MYDRGWTKSEADDTVRSRVAHAVYAWRQWWDWGHPVMWLVGRYDTGSAGTPRGRDMWWIPTEYVEGINASLVADFDQRFGCYVTKRYADVAATSDIDWRIFDLQDDGHTVKLGLWPNQPDHGGRIQSLPWNELNHRQVDLFLHWYLVDHKLKAQWLGLRSWAYYKALHAAVAQKIPFTCQAVPGRTAGGYSHWHCQLKKRHDGAHRFRNYTWDGPGSRVRHQAAEAVR